MDKYDVLKQYFGYDSFREGQEALIDTVLAGRDVLGIMPTGAGKSLCYQVPAMLLPGLTLVISPLISLMKDQVAALTQAGIPADCVTSAQTPEEMNAAIASAADGTVKLLYVSPERLENARFLALAGLVPIALVAVDEAHCISQWGQDFRPSYRKIDAFISSLPNRPVLAAFTATATDRVREDILQSLALRDPLVTVGTFDRPNLFFEVRRERDKEAFIKRYITDHPGKSGIVYCATRRSTDLVYASLERQGFSVTRYHAGLTAEERRDNQDDFIFSRKDVMVATNAFGMGIDKSDVRFVIHHSLPLSLENYYQEAGRAGRDGLDADCILLFSPGDVHTARFLIESRSVDPALTQAEMQALVEGDERRLMTMTRYARTTGCLRSFLLGYFGEAVPESCGKCGNCCRDTVDIDRTAQAVTVIQCVLALKERYGAGVIAGILAGAKRQKLTAIGAEHLSHYGALAPMKETEIKKLIDQLVLEDILEETKGRYTCLRCGPHAQELLAGTCPVVARVPVLAPEPVSPPTGGRRRRPSASDVLDTAEMALFERLRALRKDLASLEKVPPYIIFADKTLVDMCRKKPKTEAELLEVNGVGKNKLARYGTKFLNAIREEGLGI